MTGDAWTHASATTKKRERAVNCIVLQPVLCFVVFVLAVLLSPRRGKGRFCRIYGTTDAPGPVSTAQEPPRPALAQRGGARGATFLTCADAAAEREFSGAVLGSGCLGIVS